MRFRLLPFSIAGLLLVGCKLISTTTPNSPAAATSAAPSATSAPALGAGFRFSSYGPPYNPGPQYWADVGRKMASRFPEAVPQAIWIVSVIGIPGTVLSFPGSSEDVLIHFMPEDANEEALTLFDRLGVEIWLQVEPGDAPVENLIDLVLSRYGRHPCVVGFGVDVEWFHSFAEPAGQAVTDAEARAWVRLIRGYNPGYRLFLKHWESGMMPPMERDGLMFVDDAQEFESLDGMAAEFSSWGKAFAPAPVGFQYGYPADKPWWRDLADPPGDIGRAILEQTPNTEGLFWVDFTVLDMFPPNAS
jgi:hypothetical protein